MDTRLTWRRLGKMCTDEDGLAAGTAGTGPSVSLMLDGGFGGAGCVISMAGRSRFVDPGQLGLV